MLPVWILFFSRMNFKMNKQNLELNYTIVRMKIASNFLNYLLVEQGDRILYKIIDQNAPYNHRAKICEYHRAQGTR